MTWVTVVELLSHYMPHCLSILSHLHVFHLPEYPSLGYLKHHAHHLSTSCFPLPLSQTTSVSYTLFICLNLFSWYAHTTLAHPALLSHPDSFVLHTLPFPCYLVNHLTSLITIRHLITASTFCLYMAYIWQACILLHCIYVFIKPLVNSMHCYV